LGVTGRIAQVLERGRCLIADGDEAQIDDQIFGFAVENLADGGVELVDSGDVADPITQQHHGDVGWGCGSVKTDAGDLQLRLRRRSDPGFDGARDFVGYGLPAIVLGSPVPLCTGFVDPGRQRRSQRNDEDQRPDSDDRRTT
jgi:hypothetical protein